MSLSEWIAEQPEKDPFWFGERFVKRIGDDGEITYAGKPVPLRPSDLLFPSEGDRVWAGEPHNEDRDYLWQALQAIHQPDERGRIWIEPMQCWLLAEGRRVCLHDEFGTRILDRREWYRVYLRRKAKIG